MADKSILDKVWDKAKPVQGEDPSKIRQDPYGNKIRKGAFGKAGAGGWEIDHIRPVSRGGSDHLRNLQALGTRTNRAKGNSLLKRSRHNQR